MTAIRSGGVQARWQPAAAVRLRWAAHTLAVAPDDEAIAVVHNLVRPLRSSRRVVDELSAIMIACEPLAPEKRGAFLQAVADALATCPIERDGRAAAGQRRSGVREPYSMT